jgi:predicted RecA/RadA family phage recombinase
MPWTNGTGTDVASGDVVDLPNMIGVALGDIADGDNGDLAVTEVWALPKEAALAIDQGDQVYWDATAGEIDKTNTNIAAGKAFAAAAADDTTVAVKLNA